MPNNTDIPACMGPYTHYENRRLSAFLADHRSALRTVLSARRLDQIPPHFRQRHVDHRIAWLHGVLPWAGVDAFNFIADLKTIGIKVEVSGERAEMSLDAKEGEGWLVGQNPVALPVALLDPRLSYVVFATSGPAQLVGDDQTPVYRATLFGSMAGALFGSADEQRTRLWRDVYVAILDVQDRKIVIARRTLRRISWTLGHEQEMVRRELQNKLGNRNLRNSESKAVCIDIGSQTKTGGLEKPSAATSVTDYDSNNEDITETTFRIGKTVSPLGSFVRYREPRVAEFLSQTTPVVLLARFSPAAIWNRGYSELSETERILLLHGHKPWISSDLLTVFVQSLRENGLETTIDNGVATLGLVGDIDYGTESTCEKLVKAAGFTELSPRFIILDIKAPPQPYGPRDVSIHEVALFGEIYCDLFARRPDERGFRLWQSAFIVRFMSGDRNYLFSRTTYRRACSLIRRNEHGLRAAIVREDLARPQTEVVVEVAPLHLSHDEEMSISSAFAGVEAPWDPATS